MYLFVPYGNGSAVYDHPATDDPAPKSDGLGPPINMRCRSQPCSSRDGPSKADLHTIFGTPPEIRTQTLPGLNRTPLPLG